MKKNSNSCIIKRIDLKCNKLRDGRKSGYKKQYYNFRSWGGDPRAHELREVLKICSDKKIRIVVEEERKVEEREKREEERKRKGWRRN